MNLVFLGPPGAGKGTQASRISRHFEIPHISTGDIFRKNLSERTELGVLAQSYMDKGLLVPDDVTISLVEDRIVQHDCNRGFLLDGFPRTIAQAQAFDKKAALDCVVNVQVPDSMLIDRLTGRRSCGQCKGIFHINSLQSDQCPDCGVPLLIRADDQLEAVQKRLEVYHIQTHPLVEYYGEKGMIADIDGTQSIDDVCEQIITLLENRK